MDLSVVIVSFHSRDVLRRCLETVTGEGKSPSAGAATDRGTDKATDGGKDASGDLAADVIVVDNHSADGTVEMVWKEFPEVRLIANSVNAGYSAANNQGIRLSHADYVLLLNPDTEVHPGCFRTLLEFMAAHPEAGAAAPQLLNTDGSVQFSCRRFPGHHTALFSRFAVLTRLFPDNRFSSAYLMTDEGHDRVRDVDWVSGAAMLLRRKALEEVGLLDERFFMYCEDVDICYRLNQAGWKVYYVPEAKVTHRIGVSSGRKPLRVLWEHHRSMYLFYKKHYSRGIPLLDALTLVGVIMRGGFLLAMRGCRLAADSVGAKKT